MTHILRPEVVVALVVATVTVACAGATQSGRATPAPSPSAVAGGPTARTYGEMVSLGQGGGAMLLLGETAPPPPFGNGRSVDDTWIYRGTAWGTPGTSPPNLYGPAVFDPQLNRVVVVEFSSVDCNTYDLATRQWRRLSPAGDRPSGVLGGAFVYDAASGKALLFGGLHLGNRQLNNETWLYDFSADTWTKRSPSASPSPRNFGVMAFDAKSGKTVLFGGGDKNGDGLGDTWVYDSAADIWTKMRPAQSPSPRDYSAMVYDPKSDRMVLFGGIDESSGQPLGDTWTYDVTSDTWQHLATAVSPSARGWHAMAYEATSGKVVLFGGGISQGQPQKDTWLFDSTGNVWSEVD